MKRVPVASVLYDFSNAGDNQSSQLSVMRIYLDRLSTKQKFGHLPFTVGGSRGEKEAEQHVRCGGIVSRSDHDSYLNNNPGAVMFDASK